MSAHVQERLSAYLDGELPAAEQQAVEAHLQVCDECGRHLEDLAAVDELARGLPVEAPGGYFEALPARVRFKVAPRRRLPPRLPAWSWAVAAALLVAVVTPVLLRQNPQPPEAARSVAPASTPAVAPLAGDAKRLEEKEQAAGGPRAQAASPASAERRADAAYDEMQAAPAQLAAPAPMPQAAAPSGGVAQGTLGRNVAAPALLAKTEEAETKKDKARDTSASEPARAPSTPPAGTGLAAPPPEDGQLEGAAGQHLYEPKPESDADDAPVAAAEAKKVTAPRTASAARLRDAEAGRSEAPGPRLRFRALLAQVPGTTAEVRRLREQWRAFVAQEPPAAQADEGRVRVAETGAQAWRLSNDPADLAMAKQDAEAYLRRADAVQGDRVRTLLITLGN